MIWFRKTESEKPMKGKIKFRIAIAVALWLFAAPGFAADKTVGWVTGVVGKVSVQRAQTDTALAMLGMGIEEGDRIRTKTGTRIKVLFGEDTILTISDESDLTVETFRYTTARKGREILFDLHKGRVKVSTPKLPDIAGNLKVATQNAVISVSGTSFILEYDSQHKLSSVYVLEGLVGISAKDENYAGVFHVSGGETTYVKKGKYPELPVNTSQQQISFYKQIFDVPQPTNLSKVPGRSGNLVDNPKKGLEKMPMFSSYSDALSAQSEGEGGAEFDAYLASEPLEDTDIPYGAEKSKVRINIDFKDEKKD